MYCADILFIILTIITLIVTFPCLLRTDVWAGLLSRYSDYGLDGPGIEFRRSEIFHPSRPVLGPTQPPVQWVPG